MFVNAIEKVGGFTRPVFTIGRKYGSTEVDPGAATLFFVNDEGWAVTCKHVASMIIEAGKIQNKYVEFKNRRSKLTRGMNYEDELKGLEKLMEYTPDTVAQMKVNFVDCVDSIAGVECKMHPHLDIALVHFDGFTRKIYNGHAVFGPGDQEVKPGRFMCRLGFPFPEFTNFAYDQKNDDIIWTREGMKTSPRFPSEGMVTRLIGSQNGLEGVELSTPGMKGQSGGPLFDAEGIVYGMQSSISYLNLGRCIHMKPMKEFMRKEGVKYYEISENGEIAAKLGNEKGNKQIN